MRQTSAARDAVTDREDILERRGWLDHYATRLRYDEELGAFHDGTKPDVLRAENDGDKHYLFIGVVYDPDLADAATLELLRKSMTHLSNFVRQGVVCGARIVVATATLDEAEVWANVLAEMLRKMGWKDTTFAVRNIAGHWVALR